MIINVYEAKTQLSKLLDRAANGEEIILGKSGKPLARLVPYRATRSPRQPGRLAGQIDIADDFNDTPSWLIESFERNE
jgi:prevent-host-death family protein